MLGDLLRDRLLVQLVDAQIDGGNITPIRMIVSPELSLKNKVSININIIFIET